MYVSTSTDGMTGHKRITQYRLDKKKHSSQTPRPSLYDRFLLAFIKTTQEAPPPPTFTVPAFRHRKHRGDSTYLKDAYPSGFSRFKQPELGLIPTTLGHRTLHRSAEVKGILSERTRLGVPKWGHPCEGRFLKVTRVLLGGEAVISSAGNDLVQFGPSFYCGPDERLMTPPSSRLNNIGQSRPPPSLSPKCTTIDGSALGATNLLVASRLPEREAEWPHRKMIPTRIPDSSGGQRYHEVIKRDRATTGPGPWSSSANGTGNDTVGRISNHTRGCFDLDAGACAPHNDANMTKNSTTREQVREEETGPNNGANALSEHNDVGEVVVDVDTVPPTTPGDSHAGVWEEGFTRTGAIEDNSNIEAPAALKYTRQVDSGQIPKVLFVGDDRDGNGGGGRGQKARDVESVSLEQDLHGLRVETGVTAEGDNDTSGDGQVGSACPLPSVARAQEATVTCESSVSDACSRAEHASERHSCSSLDTERYGGTLSKSANDIVRSHFENPKRRADVNASLFDGATQEQEPKPATVSSPVSPLKVPSIPAFCHRYKSTIASYISRHLA